MEFATIMGLILSTGITSSLLQPVIQKLFDLGYSKIGRSRETGDKLRKLERTLLKIQSLVDQVEDKHPISNACRLLVEEFKGVLLDSDDRLNEIHLQLLNDTANDPARLEHSIRADVGQMLEDVDNLFKELEAYFITEITKLRPPQIPDGSSSFIDPSSVVGLENTKGEMIKLLLAAHDKNTTVISIVGMAGIGKTTLAQLVFNDPMVAGTFDMRMWWVCVSLEYDLIQIAKSILEAATHKICTLSNLESIMRQLKMVMMEGKFLLVLDDMWNESPSDWSDLKLLFKFAAPGSRVVVTTQSKTISSIVTTNGDRTCFLPTTLSKEDCWEIIKRKLKTDVDNREDLKDIGLRLGEKCKGLPLAAKVIGDTLHLKSKEVELDALLKYDLWDLPGDKNQFYRTLKQSYDHLPAYLKRCFVYFSIIPQSQKVKVEDLIQIWAAEGFIAQGARRIEDIGREYLEELCSRSFLQISTNTEVEMHDFIHDLARLVSTNLCLRLEDTMSTASTSFLSQNVRYLSLLCQSTKSEVFGDKLEESYRYQKLRTFLLFSHGTNFSTFEMLQELFEKFKWLRVLKLSASGIRKLSGAIVELKHLRYLDLSDTFIGYLPEGIVDLHKLETLKLENCTEFKEWPKNFEKLVKLRHLHFKRQGQMSSMPKNLGKLTSLETLTTFAVKGEAGYEIEELQNMNCLRGSISIKELQNVANSQKAQDAKLQDKEFLETLVLQWKKKAPTEAEVLEHLEPHDRLKELEVNGYHGSTLPNWICRPASVNMPSRQIKKFVLHSCPELVTLPSICHLTSLKKLEIHHCGNLASLPVGGLPSSLKSLKISWTCISKQMCEEGGSERENVKYIAEVEIDNQPIPTATRPTHDVSIGH